MTSVSVFTCRTACLQPYTDTADKMANLEIRETSLLKMSLTMNLQDAKVVSPRWTIIKPFLVIKFREYYRCHISSARPMDKKDTKITELVSSLFYSFSFHKSIHHFREIAQRLPTLLISKQKQENNYTIN